jgi:hypothetical protein
MKRKCMERDPNKMDPECVKLCAAINKIPGLQTVESCCGHGKDEFKIWFVTKGKGYVGLRNLPTLLYYLVPCHVGFLWICRVRTDCAMSPVLFVLESEDKGKEAYRQANVIADKILNYLDGGIM